ncbi:chemotaxis protein CheA [Bacterioplanes sanyensis]|uniref:Chemotaxis protein CheA n=1 Tax=Bacterioplanes sanyensis TaxID=1249553 RepID=A0A222FJZ6_9GAMM|nr:chemotaxis protein CheA [Bacterioplanes sanyensis]ASP39328.1 chemotaxis protein CheA [Bacterioplanes sanyensis]
MTELTDTFLQESQELLEQMEEALLAIEEQGQDAELINSVFRSIHTIKGAAGIFGFAEIVGFTHPVETILDSARHGQRELDEELVGLLLQSRDHLQELTLASVGGSATADLVRKGDEILGKMTSVESWAEEPEADDETPLPEAEKQWLISLRFREDAFRNGIDAISFIRYLQQKGKVVDVLTLQHLIPDSADYDAESCYLGFDILFEGNASKQSLFNVFEFAADDCDICILPPANIEKDFVEQLSKMTSDHVDRLGDMLLSVGALTKHEIERCLGKQACSQDKLGEILVKDKAVTQTTVNAALAKQTENKNRISAESRLIRVDSEKLGRLINLVGEMVISNAAIRLRIEEDGLTQLNDAVTTAEQLVEDIRDTALQLRMVQIGDSFSRFRRVVRDVSKELGKRIELEITGGDTELDKTVVEKITDPLTHLVRNSLDHGIEMPKERLTNGKPETGSLVLNAYHDSGHVVIEIEDDGAGLDLAKIREKAITNGLVREDQELTEKEISQLIFSPGLSTKDVASNLSGRGVGMDVVRRNIEELRGSIDLTTEPGNGTKITIRLPLTLAIIDGFMVGASNERYVIPLAMVEECVEMDSNDWQVEDDQQYINLRGDVLPYIRLASFLDVPGEHQHERESLVVVRIGNERAGFVVDSLYGELQTVIKPLGKIFSNFNGISGSTVLGSGEVALILDVQGLVSSAHAQMTMH